MSNKIHQIYHVARCGSTLLSYMLTEVATVYAESDWTRAMLLGSTPCNPEELYNNAVVKFPSLVSCLSTRFDGNKVFLYRPLSQHICKLKSVDPNWLSSRVSKMNQLISENTVNSQLKENVIDNLDIAVRVWILSVLQMKNTENVLWLKTNDLITNRQESVNLVCNHFDLPKVCRLHNTNISVKKSGLLGHNESINNIEKNSIVYTPYPSYGVIETSLALFDDDTKRRLATVETNFPELGDLLY
jgi:hypothetical protein